MISFKLIEQGVFAAIESGDITAKAYFETDGLFCNVCKVEYPADKLYLFQGLLRSVYNYAAERGIYMGKLSDESSFEQAKTMNFIFDGKSYVNDIPTLLMGSCSSCGDFLSEI